MPPKKPAAAAAADQARKSDLSNARFVPSDDGAQTLEPKAPEAPAADESAVDTQSHDVTSDKKDGGKKEEKDAVTIEDLTLPKSIVTRLAKGVLPPNTQIQANAILAMSKSATVFINYLASHANEHTFNANKKTISPADVFKALDDIEFGFLKEPLEAEFAKFTAMQTEKRNANRKKSTGGKPEDADMADVSTTSVSQAQAANSGSDHKTGDGDGQARAAKKQRVGEAAGAGAAVGGSETEDEVDATVDEEREEDNDDDDEDVEEDDDEEVEEDSRDETQDALEDRPRRDDGDEALDGDDSD